jgi:hypothetical protein
MRSSRSTRAWPWVVACSIWPLVIPMLWYGILLRNLHHAGSPDVLAALPEGSRASAARLNALLGSMLLRSGLKFLVSMLLLSFAVCIVVARRVKNGVSWRRAAVDVAILTLAVGAISVLGSAFRGNVDLSLVHPRPTEHFWSSLFPPWCALAAGFSFLIVQRSYVSKQQVA